MPLSHVVLVVMYIQTPEWARMNDGAGGISCKDNRAREGLHQRRCASGEHYCQMSPGKWCQTLPKNVDQKVQRYTRSSSMERQMDYAN